MISSSSSESDSNTSARARANSRSGELKAPRACKHDDNRVVADAPSNFEQEPRLADPRLALDDDEAHAFADGLHHPVEHELVLRSPTDERQHLAGPRRQRGHETRTLREQRRVVIQDAAFEIAHRGRRIQPEVVTQQAAERFAAPDRVDLPTGAVERRDLLGSEVLSIRFSRTATCRRRRAPRGAFRPRDTRRCGLPRARSATPSGAPARRGNTWTLRTLRAGSPSTTRARARTARPQSPGRVREDGPTVAEE